MPYMVVIWEDVLVVEWLGQILSAYPGVLLEETVDDWPDVMDLLMSDTYFGYPFLVAFVPWEDAAFGLTRGVLGII